MLTFLLNFLEGNSHPLSIVRKCKFYFLDMLADGSPFSFLFCLGIVEEDLRAGVGVSGRIELIAHASKIFIIWQPQNFLDVWVSQQTACIS